MISHERLDRLLGQVLASRSARWFADIANRRTAAEYDTVVCTTGFAREEFHRIGATNVAHRSASTSSCSPLAVTTCCCVPAWPRRDSLERRARGLPVHFAGFIGDRGRLATLLATADVSRAPGSHETFGLAALEALAAGSPVVASRSSALADIVTAECGAVADHANGWTSAGRA